MLAEQLQSATIVRAYQGGYTTTLRFADPKLDVIFTRTNKPSTYREIDRYVQEGPRKR